MLFIANFFQLSLCKNFQKRAISRIIFTLKTSSKFDGQMCCIFLYGYILTKRLFQKQEQFPNCRSKTSYTDQDYKNAYKNLMKIKLLRQEKKLQSDEIVEKSEFDDKLSRVTSVLKKRHLSHRNIFGSTSLSNVRFNV